MNLFRRLLPGIGADHDADAVRASVAAGDQARDARDWPAAASHYRRALDARDTLPAIWVQYGHALKEGGDVAAARDAYRRAAALKPDVADTHLQMGHAAKLAGDLDAAAASYVQALVLQPDYDDALRELQALGSRGVRIDASPLRDVWTAAPADGAAPMAQAAAAPDAAGLLAQTRSTLAGLLEQARALDAAAAPDDIAARHAREQLASAVEILRKLDARDLAPASAHNGAHDGTKPAPAAAAEIIFDATDLIHHFRGSRLPTGIQRVQLEMISAFRPAGGAPPRVCYLGERGWLEAPGPLFARLCQMCTGQPQATPAAWQQAVAQLDLLMLGGPAMAFPRGAWLVSLGTSWFPDYLLHVRLAQRESGVRYVPFVHDLIPVVMPEHCVDDLVDRFVAWLLGAFAHADRFLVNSECTRRDLVAAAARLGHHLPHTHVEVVTLDADIRKPAPAPRGTANAGMQGWDASRQPFVLMLSTVEPRKNHLAAFRAWRALIERHGARRVPQLLCVGGKGWKNEAVFAALESDPVLAGRVTMLSGLTDAQLALLFERCLFTLYPSLYEGWGLPVTESLCYGKVPLVSDVSALPEAGGSFAHYFDPASPVALLQSIERLTFDNAYRQSREAAIRAGFRPRTWAQLGAQMARAVNAWETQQQPGERTEGAPRLVPGRYYPIATQRAPALRRGMIAGESLRAGDGWHSPEDWGCWSKPGESRLAWLAGDDMRGERIRVYLGLRGMPGLGARYRLENGEGLCAEGELKPGETRWIATDARMPASAGQPLELILHSSRMESLADATDGADRRVIGPAVLGLYLCAAGDMAARLRLVEAVALGSLDTLTDALTDTPTDALTISAGTDGLALAAHETAQLLADL